MVLVFSQNFCIIQYAVKYIYFNIVDQLTTVFSQHRHQKLQNSQYSGSTITSAITFSYNYANSLSFIMTIKHFTIISIFPNIFAMLTNYGVIGRAIQNKLVNLTTINPRDYTRDKHATVDARPFGGGPGMLMKAEPLLAALQKAKHLTPEPYTCVYLSPQGQVFSQSKAEKSAGNITNFILICGRYDGIDQRITDTLVDEVWSIGNYVLTGGELPAMVVMDSIIRLIPEVLGNSQSSVTESFNHNLLDYPQYTRPQKVMTETVPEVLLSGNHKRIKLWRLKQSLGYTLRFRPEMLAKRKLSAQEVKLLHEFMNESDNE